jgi:hypothetical protein
MTNTTLHAMCKRSLLNRGVRAARAGSPMLAVAVLSLMMPVAPAAAEDHAKPEIGSFHTQLMQHLREFQGRSLQPEWVNPWAPGVSVSAPEATAESADRRLQTLVAGYTRDMLDRGGWSNPWVSGDTYAAGVPLQTVAVGSGVTSHGAPDVEPLRLLAAR